MRGISVSLGAMHGPDRVYEFMASGLDAAVVERVGLAGTSGFGVGRPAGVRFGRPL